ncbi:MAG: outer membrane lipoprotein-sorting protein [Candidatus Latescibacteria bacterium]|nr:outer membrane lipoprotein-sorting protein [Candidatus Latescibacterota bacterium]
MKKHNNPDYNFIRFSHDKQKNGAEPVFGSILAYKRVRVIPLRFLFIVSMMISYNFGPGVLSRVEANASPDLTAREIMAGYRSQRSSRDERSKLTMKLLDSRGRERIRKLEQVTITDDDDNQKMLITVDEPEDIRGTAFLIIEHTDSDDDQWLYLPAFRKVRRVLPNEKSDSFLGSDFFYEDLETEDLEHYEYVLTGEESIDGKQCWKIEARPADSKTLKDSGYSKRELWITQDKYVGLQTRFYDKKGKLIKEFRALDVKDTGKDDKWRAYRLEMHNLESDHRTVILYSDYILNNGVPDWIFSRAYLERGK